MTLAPSRISTTSSVGMRISPMLSTIPSASALCLRLSRTLFSYPEYVCTMYHCFAMVTRLHLPRMLEDPIDDVEEERIHDPQEESEDEHRHDHDQGGALDFLPGRPGGPLQLPLHLREEGPQSLEPVHAAPGGPRRPTTRSGRPGGIRTPNIRFWRPAL